MSTSLKAPEPAALRPSSMLRSTEDSCQPITLAVSHRKAALQYDSTPSSSTGNSETSSACKPAAHEHKGAPAKQHSESSSTTSSTSVTLQLSRSGAANNPKAFSKCWPEYRIVRGRQVLVMCGCEVVVWACVVLILLILGLAVGLPVGLVLSSAKGE